MFGVYALFGAAVVLIIAAVFIYSKAEDNSFAQLLLGVNESRGAAKKAVEACAAYEDQVRSQNDQIEQLKNAIIEYTKSVHKDFEPMQKEFEIMRVRQLTLEKKIIATTRNMNVTLTQPIMVDLVDKAKPTVKTPGPAKDLLRKSGVVPNHKSNGATQ